MRSQCRALVAIGVVVALFSCSKAEPDSAAGGQPSAAPEGQVGRREAKVDRNTSDVSKKAPAEEELLGTAAGSTVGAGGLGAKGTGIGGGGTAHGVVGGAELGDVEAIGSGNTEQFTDHGVNDFVRPELDRVSTFSVDVDTGSYTISRRKLREGTLPPEAAVRVEEFVNYLDYAYAPPTDDSLFRVHTELAPHPFSSGHHLLKVGLKGKELPTGNRAPLHLTFLVDVSGSMASADRLPLAKRVLHYLVDNLGEEDTVAIATYAGDNRRVLEPTHTTRPKLVHDAIDSLSSGGGTAMESGMAMAYAMARESYLEGAENRVIVLSDGDANIGGSSHTEILDTIGKHAGKGITMSTVGFGTGNYKDAMMEQLADKGDGNYAYIDSMEEGKKVFGTDLGATLRTIARDVKVQVEFDPAAVHSYRLIGYENRDIADEDFRNDAVDAGEIGSGHQVTAVYELVLVDDHPANVATVRLRAKPKGVDAPAREWTIPVDRPSAATFESAGSETRLAFGVASFAELLRGSPHVAEVTYDQVLAIVRGAVNAEREDHQELIELIERARGLSGQGPGVTVTAAR